MKQRNYEDLMYDMQSLQEKNGRLKDRVRVVVTGGSVLFKLLCPVSPTYPPPLTFLVNKFYMGLYNLINKCISYSFQVSLYMLISRNKLAHNHDPYLSEFQDSVVNKDNGNFNDSLFFFRKSGVKSRGSGAWFKLASKLELLEF